MNAQDTVKKVRHTCSSDGANNHYGGMADD